MPPFRVPSCGSGYLGADFVEVADVALFALDEAGAAQIEVMCVFVHISKLEMNIKKKN